MNFLINKEDFSAFLERLKSDFEVIIPVKKNKSYFFEVMKSAKELDLDDYQNSIYPPKDFFFSQSEVLFEFKRDSKVKVKSEVKRRKRVIFGIRPCDYNGTLLLDEMFLGEYNDPFYKEKRENTIIMVLYCNKTGKYCFCGSTGDDIPKKGFDLLITDIDNKYFIKIGSEKGEKTIKDNIDLFETTLKRYERKKLKFRKKLNIKNLQKAMMKNLNATSWKKETEKCLSCAACTITCPTCSCFDVKDVVEFDMEKGKRIRVRDSCQLIDFTEVAGGHIFREERTERLKQRIYCKLVYFKNNHDVISCTGCGRCIESCPTKIDFTEIVNKFKR